MNLRAVGCRAWVCQAHRTLGHFNLVPPVSVAARVDAIAPGYVAVSVGAAPEGSVSEACYCYAIRHQQIERLSVLASLSDLLLHVLSCPRGSGSGTFPLTRGV